MLDREELRAYVSTLETERHLHGWDQPARLYRVYRRDDGELGHDPVRLETFAPDPVTAVEQMAVLLEHIDVVPHGRRMLAQITGPQPTLAFVTIQEAWNRVFSPEEQAARDALPPAQRPKLADLPGAQECRIAVAMASGDDTLLQLARARDETPLWARDRTVTEDMMFTERLSSALVRLTWAEAEALSTKGTP